MKISMVVCCLLHMALTMMAQPPTVIDFEQQSAEATGPGMVGKALDLADVERRLAIAVPNPLREATSFTLMVWVKAAKEGHEAYDILSAATDVKFRDKGWKRSVIQGQERTAATYDGWKLGVQENGAWCFTARTADYMYTYRPTPGRQPIRDGNWHLLAVSYEAAIDELRFFYDGEQMAIAHVPELQTMRHADTLVIGNSADSDPDYRTSEWHTFYGQIDDVQLLDRVAKPSEISSYYRRVMEMPIAKRELDTMKTLKVTTTNIFHGGNERGKEVGRDNMIALLKKEDSDIFIIQETYGSVEAIADALGYQCYLISSNLSIISRYPIDITYRIFKPFNSGGARICLPNGSFVNVIALWLTHLPDYKRAFLRERPDLETYMEEERHRRGEQAIRILGELADHLRIADGTPLVVGGDLNSGSHLDWTTATADAHAGYVVPWPVSMAFAEAGLSDSFRDVHPDPTATPGTTIPAQDKGPAHLHDRIDYLYYKGNALRPVKSYTVSTHEGRGAFPSDHAMVSTVFQWRH